MTPRDWRVDDLGGRLRIEGVLEISNPHPRMEIFVPELRRYLLRDALLATRELDRLRNRLNTQLRWADWVERPIQLYESQRTLFQLRSGRIEPLLLTEPRDKELNQRGWWQRQVALLLEARDALAPQVQSLVRRIGDLAVILLTQVLGRAIGLVGRGIAQGMGRSFGRG